MNLFLDSKAEVQRIAELVEEMNQILRLILCIKLCFVCEIQQSKCRVHKVCNKCYYNAKWRKNRHKHGERKITLILVISVLYYTK